jgi:20S proteasome subunit beta 1
VADAAAEFRKYCYDYRSSLMAGIIVAGWDKDLGGQVYSIPLGGMCIREKCSIGGSGSSYIYGFRKEFYRENMAKDECIEFVKKGNLLEKNNLVLLESKNQPFYSGFPCNVS